jgi:hypothetical protein
MALFISKDSSEKNNAMFKRFAYTPPPFASETSVFSEKCFPKHVVFESKDTTSVVPICISLGAWHSFEEVNKFCCKETTRELVTYTVKGKSGRNPIGPIWLPSFKIFSRITFLL